MTFQTVYSPETLRRSELDAIETPVVLEFGTNWCGYCKAAQPMLATAFAAHPPLTHIKIEDGSGRPLGRSFRVKLWPTLIFMRGGQEVARVVRPTEASQIDAALATVSAP